MNQPSQFEDWCKPFHEQGLPGPQIVRYHHDFVPHDLWLEVCRYYGFFPDSGILYLFRDSEEAIYLRAMMLIRTGMRPRFKI